MGSKRLYKSSLLFIPVLFRLRLQESPMPTVQVRYDGWISLPSDVRQHFGITTGDQLEELEAYAAHHALRHRHGW